MRIRFAEAKSKIRAMPVPASLRSAAMNPRLVALSGPLIRDVFLITEKVLTVGRALENDVILQDNSVSRHHFSVQMKDGRPYLRDLKTPSGTFVNDDALLERFLQPGD